MFAVSMYGFSDGSVSKKATCNAVDSSSIPGSERSAGEGICYPLQYSWASLVAQLVKNRFYFTYLLFYSVSFLRRRILAFNQLQEFSVVIQYITFLHSLYFFIYTPTDNVLDLPIMLLILLTFLSGILLFMCAHYLGNFFT